MFWWVAIRRPTVTVSGLTLLTSLSQPTSPTALTTAGRTRLMNSMIQGELF